LAKATTDSPSLLDVMMRGMTGWDVVDRLRQDEATAGIPVVLLSARTHDEDRRRADEVGVGRNHQAFDPAELAATIRRLARPSS
jgi:CheY-like chemotaxis protein